MVPPWAQRGQGLSLYWTIAVPQPPIEFESGQDIFQFGTVVCSVDSILFFGRARE